MAHSIRELFGAAKQYLGVSEDEEDQLVRDTTDVLWVALRNAQRSCQKRHDFELAKGSIHVVVDPVTGGDWTEGRLVDGAEQDTLPGHATINLHIPAGQDIVSVEPSVEWPIDVSQAKTLVLDDALWAGDFPVLYVHQPAESVTKLLVIDRPNVVTVDHTQAQGDWSLEFGAPPRETKKITNMSILSDDGVTETPVRFWSKSQLAGQIQRSLDVKVEGFDFREHQGLEDTAALPIVVVQNNILQMYPRQDQPSTVVVDGHFWQPPYVSNDDTDWMLDNGFDFLMWSVVIEVNHLVRSFVDRQEATMGPPLRQQAEAWKDLVLWDSHLTVDKWDQYE